MKRFALVLVVITVLASVVSFAQDNEDAPNETCGLSSNHGEWFNENNRTLLRIQSAIRSENNPLDVLDIFNTYFTVLSSMRRGHEALTPDLPSCAVGLNTAYIAAITASQDVTTLLLAIEADPDRARIYENRLESAQEYLREQWATLSDVIDSLDFVIDETLDGDNNA